jgi:hypothetical protein
LKEEKMARLIKDKIGEAKKMSGMANVYIHYKIPEKIDIMVFTPEQSLNVEQNFINELRECIEYNQGKVKWNTNTKGERERLDVFQYWIEHYPENKEHIDKYFPEAML